MVTSCFLLSINSPNTPKNIRSHCGRGWPQLARTRAAAEQARCCASLSHAQPPALDALRRLTRA
eukprot:3129637-Rhodomonas_salina.1